MSASSKFELHKRTLLTYYSTHPSSLRIFTEVVKNRSTVVSLRVLDWFVTNYVTAASIPGETTEERIQRQHLYFIYTQNLSSYKKVWFDPFARELPGKGSHKILFDTVACTMTIFPEELSSSKAPTDDHDNDRCVATTIGQLNFFRCAIEYGMIQYVFTHHQRIQAHMLDGLSSRKRIKAEENKNVFQPLGQEEGMITRLPQLFANDPAVHVVVPSVSPSPPL